MPGRSETKIYELLYPGRQSHFKGQSTSQSSRLFKNYLKGQGEWLSSWTKRRDVTQHLIKMHSVSLWFKKVAFGLWNEIRSKSPRPSRRPFVIIFFQFDNFSAGIHFLPSSCRLWCKPTVRSLAPASAHSCSPEGTPSPRRDQRRKMDGKRLESQPEQC